jgi:hypothetical protein
MQPSLQPASAPPELTQPLILPASWMLLLLPTEQTTFYVENVAIIVTTLVTINAGSVTPNTPPIFSHISKILKEFMMTKYKPIHTA